MSHYSHVRVQFTDGSAYEIETGTRDLAERYGVALNKERSWSGEEAMSIIENPVLQSMIAPFHKAVLNLLLVEQERQQAHTDEYNRAYEAQAGGEKEPRYQGVYVIINHHG